MKKYLGILKQIGVVTGAIGTVWVVFTAWDALRDQGKQTQEMVVDVWEEVVIQQGEIKDIKDTLGRIEKKVEDNSDAIYSTNRIMQYERQHRDEYTKEQMDAQLKEFEALIKKNNETVLLNPN